MLPSFFHIPRICSGPPGGAPVQQEKQVSHAVKFTKVAAIGRSMRQPGRDFGGFEACRGVPRALKGFTIQSSACDAAIVAIARPLEDAVGAWPITRLRFID